VHAFRGLGARLAGGNRDLVRNDEGRIEAHAELTDQLGVFLLVTGELVEEVGSTGLGDGAQVLDHFIPGHANAVIPDGDGPPGNHN